MREDFRKNGMTIVEKPELDVQSFRMRARMPGSSWRPRPGAGQLYE